jgi:hypothetical protein
VESCAEPDFIATPQALFDSGFFNSIHRTYYHAYAVSTDGQRFLIPRPEATVTADFAATPLTVVLNWTVALNKK